MTVPACNCKDVPTVTAACIITSRLEGTFIYFLFFIYIFFNIQHFLSCFHFLNESWYICLKPLV